MENWISLTFKFMMIFYAVKLTKSTTSGNPFHLSPTEDVVPRLTQFQGIGPENPLYHGFPEVLQAASA